MDIDIKIGEGSNELKASIDGKDVSSRLKKITINKSIDTIPEVTMTFIPEKCTINGKIAFITLEKELKDYSINELLKELGDRGVFVGKDKKEFKSINNSSEDILALGRKLTEYEKKVIDKLNEKFYLQKCNNFNTKELKQDLIKLYKDDEFLWGYVNRLSLINHIFNSFVKNEHLFEKEKLTLEDLKG